MYDYECEKCHTRHTQMNSIANHKEGGECCGQKRKQIHLSAPMIDAQFLGSANNPGYHCPVSDRWIDSTRKRKSMMSEFDVIPAN